MLIDGNEQLTSPLAIGWSGGQAGLKLTEFVDTEVSID